MLAKKKSSIGSNSQAIDPRREISLSGFHFTQQTNPAVIKYIKSQRETMRSLDLSATGLQSRTLTYVVNEISDPQATIRLESLNLS